MIAIFEPQNLWKFLSPLNVENKPRRQAQRSLVYVVLTDEWTTVWDLFLLYFLIPTAMGILSFQNHMLQVVLALKHCWLYSRNSSAWAIHVFLKRIVYVCMYVCIENERDGQVRERTCYHPLIHSPNAYNDWGWPGAEA